MKKIKVLVFPCGSEVGLEIYRSLCFSTHIELIGASSTDDHGGFVYENYYGKLPFSTSPDFIPQLITLIAEKHIDAVYPAMDSVIELFTSNQHLLGCKIISSPHLTNAISLSKKLTYEKLGFTIPVPIIYTALSDIPGYPVFAKPEIGYGSRGANKIKNLQQAETQIAQYPNSIFMEYLPGNEFTIDCFTNKNRELLFCGCRQRSRIMNGISVHTATMPLTTGVKKLAEAINDKMHFRGAWFFQVKENINGDFTLLEVATRLAGSSAVYRCQGINFAMLSVFDAFDKPISVYPNALNVTLDRALENKYRVQITFSKVYIDYDDTVIVNSMVNTLIIKVLFHFINQGKKLILITRHAADIQASLAKYRLTGLFDEVLHITNQTPKSNYIDPKHSIFIDDSFEERKEVLERLGIPVFAPDAVESLI